MVPRTPTGRLGLLEAVWVVCETVLPRRIYRWPLSRA